MCQETNFGRRGFIKRVSMLGAIAALSYGTLGLVGCSAQSRPAAGATQTDTAAQTTRMPYTAGFGSMPCSKCIAPKEMSWRTTIAPGGEKGEPMVISGTIYQPDGKTPAEGIVLFVYHTDATGYYNKDDDPYNPRLRGWMRTGKDGRYEFTTIKPAPYPHRTTPAHIHAQIFSDTIPEYSIDEYLFEGDPFLTPAERAKLTGRGGSTPIIKLTRGEDGILRGVRDIKLDSTK